MIGEISIYYINMIEKLSFRIITGQAFQALSSSKVESGLALLCSDQFTYFGSKGFDLLHKIL